MFDGVDYQEDGVFKTLYFKTPLSEAKIWALMDFKSKRVKWAGQSVRDGKYLLFVRELVSYGNKWI
jgi:hypothetical protein